MDFPWAPMTPAKPCSTKPSPSPSTSPICTIGQENEVVHPHWLDSQAYLQENQESSNGNELENESLHISRDFESWEAGVGLAATSQLYGPDGASAGAGAAMFNEMNDLDKWTNVSFGDLLALAHAGAAPTGPVNAITDPQTEGSQSRNSPPVPDQEFLHATDFSTSCNQVPDKSNHGSSIASRRRECFDLNSPPRTVSEVVSREGIPSQFAPITPDQATRAYKEQVSNFSELSSQVQSSATMSMELQENHAPDKGGGECELNITTPQQKPRRKKHRPKVVIEGKPKRVRRIPKPVAPDGTVVNKRKYVRRNGGIKITAGPTENGDDGTVASTVAATPGKRKYVRRNTAIDSSAIDSSATTPDSSKRKYVRRKGAQGVHNPAATPLENDETIVQPTRNSCRRSLNFDSEIQVNETPTQNFIAQDNWNVNNHLQHAMELGIGRAYHSQASKRYMSIFDGQQPVGPSTPIKNHQTHYNCSNSACLTQETQARGSKRPHCGTNVTGDRHNSLQEYLPMFHSNAYNRYGDPNMHFPAIYRQMTLERHTSATSRAQFVVAAAENSLAHKMSPQRKLFASESVHGVSAAQYDYGGTSTGYGVSDYDQRLMKRSKGPNQSHPCEQLLISMGEPTNPGMVQVVEVLDQPQRCKEEDPGAKIRSRVTRKKQSRRRSSIAPPLAITWKPMSLIDEIIERFRHLSINAQSSSQFGYREQNALIPHQTMYPEQNALVVYQRDGSIVPFKEPAGRRRKPRAKVNMDDETSRVWKLLLEDINSEGINGTDEEKAKWWENERKVFQGRTDSFIARMHLVQGDRRFSPWKGSVVDSVVGVFLTQNVSDHLSSSAFMSLGAQYPLKSENNLNKSNEEKTCIIEEPEVCVLDVDDRIAWHEKSNQTTCGQVSAEQQYMEHNIDDIVSSQNSVDSSSDAQTEKSELCSLSNSEGTTMSEAKTNLVSGSNSFVELLQMAGTTMLHGVCNQTSVGGSSQSESDVCITDNKDWSYDTEAFTSHNPGTQEGSRSSETTENSELSAESANHTFEQVPRSSTEVNLCPNQDPETQIHQASDSSNVSSRTSEVIVDDNPSDPKETPVQSSFNIYFDNLDNSVDAEKAGTSKAKGGKTKKEQPKPVDWDNLRKENQVNGKNSKKTASTMDSVDWEAIRRADVKDVADAIKARGMNNKLAERIKGFLDRIVSDHGSIDLEWLRDVPPDKAKEYLLSIRGLGLKSVECVRLLTLHHLAFPVDTNVGRIAVRLGWVPLQPLPESLQLHLLEMYPVLESIQQYLWPRLCKLDQRTLYELHYQMITFGKVFCTKSKPNCNACPMRGECRHFASAFASARFALPAPEEKTIVVAGDQSSAGYGSSPNLCLPPANEQNSVAICSSSSRLCPPQDKEQFGSSNPIVEVPASPEPTVEEPPSPSPEPDQIQVADIEDFEDPDEIPTIKLNMEEFTQNLQKFVGKNMELQEVEEMSQALVALSAEAASIPAPKLKSTSRLRTEHHVYELPDSHPLLQGLDRREPDDPSPYLLSIWTPGETADSVEPPETKCSSQECGRSCEEETCFSCSSLREANSQTVRGTLLIPCRTAMRGSFPLNGTYFQVNEVFADHASSISPIDVPRSWIWNLPRRTVYFGTSASSIFRGLNTEEIQYCFWRGFLCVRGFEQESRVPRPLVARFHFPASKMTKTKGRIIENE